MNTLYHAQARIDDLRRRAEQEQLATLVRAGRPSRSIALYRQAKQYLGQGLIWLGSRLHEPVCQPVESATMHGTTANVALVLRECC